jgi:hypothetical protein
MRLGLPVISRLLKQRDYRLRVNRKIAEGKRILSVIGN